ncbi:hypothetical protein Pint_26068 [Pistacia integerrima]|uniref:Uncharacterized protein n=1 Tax=Pistacia integerrima TaxID=434235 RepID=A0ACC0YAI2_9ROSI|nr:hypothetical protein Pint_26068 [Pistacia integerrima]
MVVKHLLCVKKILDPQGPFGKWICLSLCVIASLLDPLFFYIPVINDLKKCIGLDKTLGITASVLRSVFDFFYIIYIIRMPRNLFAPWSNCGGDNSQKNARKRFLCFFLVELLAILPLPQFKIASLQPVSFMNSKFANVLPRVIRIYPLFTKATRTSGKLAGATWLKAAFNLLLYMFAGHVFGALWYFFAIDRETVCWSKACINRTRCHYGSFYCADNLGDYSFLNDFCPTKTQNTTLYDFGIFHDALQFGIVEVTDFPQKFLHCFRWGLQNLRCLAPPSFKKELAKVYPRNGVQWLATLYRMSHRRSEHNQQCLTSKQA